MPIAWTGEAEARLLLGILDQLKGVKLDYKALAAYMGPGCTVPALHQHLFKLRREAGAAGAALGKPAGSPPSTLSPSKRSKRPRSPELKTPSSIKKARKVYGVSDDDDDKTSDGNCDLKIIKDEDESGEKTAFVDFAN
ncbi:hypothetical protein BJY01DRAFT_75672 [Aspergillus pseudoustus]|uniref:Uncharacterized protein n=1 Tax=Aspergillus pseudoustus TaxID=1810923 RepID=A0ABR4J670_9EURO